MATRLQRLCSLLLRGPAGSFPVQAAVTALIWAGAACVAYSGYMHLYLREAPYLYRDVPVIGVLFLIQGSISIAIALFISVSRRLFAVLLGAALLATSVIALVISAEAGMFGFRERWSNPYVASTFAAEIIGAVLLLVSAVVLAWPAEAGTGAQPASGPFDFL